MTCAGGQGNGRCNVTVFVSRDNGQTFPHSHTLCEGLDPSRCQGGYSVVQMLDENTVGVLHTVSGGCEMTFARLDARQPVARQTSDGSGH